MIRIVPDLTHPSDWVYGVALEGKQSRIIEAGPSQQQCQLYVVHCLKQCQGNSPWREGEIWGRDWGECSIRLSTPKASTEARGHPMAASRKASDTNLQIQRFGPETRFVVAQIAQTAG